MSERSPRQAPAWLTVHSKPRQERLARAHLERQGFECFLPLAWNPRRRRGRAGQRVEVLFPRYLFVRVRMGVQNIAPLNYTRGVSGLVRFGGRLAVVPDWVIAGLRAAVDPDTGLVALGPPELAAGDEVEVFEGPLAGLRGIVSSVDPSQRAVLLLELLGREQSVAVPASSLRRPD